MLKGNGKIISTEEAARLLGVSQQSVRKWCQSGKIRAKTTPGGFYKIERSELERFRQEFNMPNLDSNEVVLIIEENNDRIKFLSGLLEMLDLDVVTAHDLISIGIAIGNKKPSFIISGTKLSNQNLDDLLKSFSLNPETRDLPVLVIANEGDNLESTIKNFKKERKINVLYEPLDIHQFKREVENLS
ncbi:MAG: helix-turn-helix domain-containing protein [Spirochaetota bacterium]